MTPLVLVVVASLGVAAAKPKPPAAPPPTTKAAPTKAETTVTAAAKGATASTKTEGAADEHPRVVAALRDYRALRIERVIDPLEDLLFDGSLDDATRARALYLLGLAYAQTGETETARERLVAACTLDPAVDLDVPVPRKMKSLVAAARDTGARAHAAAPRPTTTPPATPPPTTTTTTATPTTATTAGAGAGPWPWVVAGVGGAALVGGGVASGLGWSLATQSAAATTTQREAVRLADDANAALVVAGVAAGVGAGVGAVGFAWAALSSPP
ncbi:MAG: hypothetical protein FJ137_22400 [Deltaproteobacteria bacterium]|nr:hypothetical protein [Deltaproteobacteria bacterium]